MKKVNRSNWVDNLLMLLLILNSSGIFFTNYQKILLLLSLWFVTILLIPLLKKRFKFNKFFVYLCFFYLGWSTIIVLKFQSIDYITYIGFFIRIFYAYFTLKIIKNNFFNLFVRVVYKLTIVSLIFYFIGQLFPNVMENIFNLLEPYHEFLSTERSDGMSLFVYTFQLSKLNRNFGFLWEPGAFAGILILAMIIHLSINFGRLDKVFWVLFIALLTTFSTTGYLALFIVIIFKIYISRFRSKLIYFILGIVGLLFVYNLAFVGKKIRSQYEHFLYNPEAQITLKAPNRFLSFTLDMELFKDNFWFGVGLSDKTRYREYKYYGASTSGVSDYLVKFGFVGFMVLLFNLHRSFKLFMNTTGCRKGHIFLILAVLFISLSEAFLYLPLFWAFQFYHIVNK